MLRALAFVAAILIGSTGATQSDISVQFKGRGDQLNLDEKVVALLKRRLAEAGISSIVKADVPNCVQIKMLRETEINVRRLASVRGQLSFKAGGEVYKSQGNPVVEARLDTTHFFPFPAVDVRLANPELFRQFTVRHLHQQLTVSIDGRNVSTNELETPIGSTAIITGRLSEEEARLLAAVLDAGPSPVALTVVRSCAPGHRL
jgi:hypothetical protein